MQATHQPYNQAIPPSGTQMQEMFELSSWLGDVFTTEPQAHHFPSMSTTTDDIEFRPEMFLSDGMDHEVGIITSSPAIPLEFLDVLHPVSPTPSPYVPISMSTATLPATDEFKLLSQAPVSSPPAKRKLATSSTSVVSDSSDNEDTSRRPVKRQRKSQPTPKPVKVVSSTVKPRAKSTAATKAPAANTKTTRAPDVVVKKQVRREKNREHAKKSRSKKRDFNQALEESVMALREENKKLRDMVYSRFGEAKAKEMVKERIRTPEDKMIEALKKPANKVLSQSVIHYLESLRHDINLNSTR